MSASIITDTDTAAQALRAGQLVAIPTETVYGLGANALDESAVLKIFTAKNRPSFDPLIIHQSTPERILAYASEISEEAFKLAEAFWPGPLTMVLPKHRSVPDMVVSGLPAVALRVPDHPVALELLSKVDFPVAAPSANPFGFVSPTTAQHVKDQLGERVDYILDGGPCRVGLESTIVAFPNGEATILRKGGLPIEQIEEILGHRLAVKTHSSSQPEAPGMLSKHYSPGNHLEIFERLEEDQPIPAGSARIVFGRGGKAISYDDKRLITTYDLSPNGELAQAAQQLFTFLRLMATHNYPFVAAELLPETGLGRAINDRLRRAAATE
ncbi:L-threonylcarbamoyladenylate synthase [Neolewinella persica]|uniref:L-threonylcarbamoyladenylate synthase n=1 Tax=Neolewinella persica TaxID=70998 RepID=UPI00036CD9F0|nr:L-threonylcarbamoyladenylate synthase [Neolewinella persica]